jgi:pimeloyl-ACP methyl ester carboxylesterase
LKVRRTLLQSFCEGRLFAERIGDAPSEVVGLHGWARSRGDLVAALTGLNALLIDLPGFGVSPEPPTAWDTKAYAALVAEALDAAQGPYVVLGHSFGGRVAVKLAAWWPELVSGIVLAGVPLLPRSTTGKSPSLPFRMARWGSQHGIVSQDRMERLRQRYGSEDYKNARGVMRSVLVCMVNESYEEDLPRITCPVELVWGSNDTVTPLEPARRACGLIPNARLEIVDGAGHMTPLTHPDVLQRSVRRLAAASIP